MTKLITKGSTSRGGKVQLIKEDENKDSRVKAVLMMIMICIIWMSDDRHDVFFRV